MNKPIKVWLVGAGGMAVDYFKVLKALECDLTVIGRGHESAEKFKSATGQSAIVGGLDSYLKSAPDGPDAAIVCVGVDELAATAIQLIQAGVSTVLVEKPGAIDADSLDTLVHITKKADASVFIAYNRRFYAATLQAKRMIEADGGLLSCNFEFTEWAHIIEKQDNTERVKNKWFLANSSHVADLAFHLGGAPVEMNSFTTGLLSWHPSAAAFAGAGMTEKGIPFSYQANWDAPGRWGVEVLTSKSRLIFRPMESLQIMRRGSVAVEKVEIDDKLDTTFKPGLYEQVKRFLNGQYEDFCSLDEQVQRWPYYCQIAAY